MTKENSILILNCATKGCLLFSFFVSFNSQRRGSSPTESRRQCIVQDGDKVGGYRNPHQWPKSELSYHTFSKKVILIPPMVLNLRNGEEQIDTQVKCAKCLNIANLLWNFKSCKTNLAFELQRGMCAYVIIHIILPTSPVILSIENGFHWILDTLM